MRWFKDKNGKLKYQCLACLWVSPFPGKLGPIKKHVMHSYERRKRCDKVTRWMEEFVGAIPGVSKSYGSGSSDPTGDTVVVVGDMKNTEKYVPSPFKTGGPIGLSKIMKILPRKRKTAEDDPDVAVSQDDPSGVGVPKKRKTRNMSHAQKEGVETGNQGEKDEALEDPEDRVGSLCIPLGGAAGSLFALHNVSGQLTYQLMADNTDAARKAKKTLNEILTVVNGLIASVTSSECKADFAKVRTLQDLVADLILVKKDLHGERKEEVEKLGDHVARLFDHFLKA